MSPRTYKLVALAVLLGGVAEAAPYRRPSSDFEPTYAPLPEQTTQPTGAIFQPSTYASLVEDRHARRIGDVLTIQLTEQTQATKTASANTGRDSNLALNLPTAKPFSYIPKGLLSGGGSSTFKGAGTAAQSNQLSGAVTVTVAQVLPGGNLLVRGQKLIKINRGEEYVQISGIVRPEDVGPDNQIPSTRVADARIAYSGTGEIAQSSRMGWFHRFFNAISPF
jgi:flagellar L-ring protein FlgH